MNIILAENRRTCKTTSVSMGQVDWCRLVEVVETNTVVGIVGA